MAEPHTHMQADGITHFVETNQTEADLSKEKEAEYLAAIVYEKTGYEAQLKGLQEADVKDEARIKAITDDLASVTAELERISGKTESRKTPGVRK